MKYYKLTGTNVVIAVEDDQTETAMRRIREAGYEPEECERPENAEMMLAPSETRTFTRTVPFTNPFFEGEKYLHYTGPCCARCKKRFKRNAWCDSHSWQQKCYRFVLEK